MLVWKRWKVVIERGLKVGEKMHERQRDTEHKLKLTTVCFVRMVFTIDFAVAPENFRNALIKVNAFLKIQSTGSVLRSFKV